ncbi:origin recognition complex subunit 6 domain-containing protein [Trichoderma aethiopicum]
MSKSAVELALVSLMPTYGSDLPPSLVESASSLLAQSRHLASTLKAEEEIARLYACAHIACNRLKIPLDLPTIEPRPPIPPKVYKRLYTHLDNILPNTSASGRRTRRQREVGDSPASQTRPVPSRPEPTKEASLAQFRRQAGSNLGTPTKSQKHGDLGANWSEIYPWVQPVIRHLCAGSGHKKLAPSMLAGMESILLSGGRKSKDAWAWENTTALCAAIIFFVAMRVSDAHLEQAMQPQIYEPARAEVIGQLRRARQEVQVIGLEPDALWEGWTDPSTEDLDAAVSRVRESGWLEADWYDGIADVIDRDLPQDHDTEHGHDEEDAAQAQQQRADTMFQDKYDYLSESRRAEYRAWKEATLAKIAMLSASLGSSGGQ